MPPQDDEDDDEGHYSDVAGDDTAQVFLYIYILLDDTFYCLWYCLNGTRHVTACVTRIFMFDEMIYSFLICMFIFVCILMLYAMFMLYAIVMLFVY